MRALPVLLLSTTLLGSLASGAGATEVRIDTDDDVQRVEVVAERGQRNTISVSLRSRTLIVRDRGARLRAPSACRRLSAHAVRCRISERRELVVDAADGNDRVDVARTAEPVLVRGGRGADRLTGGRGDDHLHGGAGADALAGGAGDDLLIGDPGGRRGHDDVLDGGRGSDVASYEGHRRALRIDLARDRATSSVQRDRLRSIEGADGGGRADRIAGDAGPNVLEGFGGADTILGGGGADRLDGEGCSADPPSAFGETQSCVETAAPRDRLLGGADDDLLLQPGPLSDCGAGDDVTASDDADRFTPPQACEWWRAGGTDGIEISTVLRLSGDAVLADVRRTGGEVNVYADAPGLTLLATGPVSSPDGRAATARLPLTAAGREQLRPDRLPAQVRVDANGPAQAVLTVR